MNYIAYLENRLTKLERMVNERSVGRGKAPSIAMTMWSFLMDNGPKTLDQIRQGLGDRYANGPTINSYLKDKLIVKNGNRYAANPDYVWDDVGKIDRPSAADIANAANLDDVPTEQPTRGDRQPAVKSNIWSTKTAEVQAALDSGVDANIKNDKDATPLMKAMSAKTINMDIVKLLLEHGADANGTIKNGDPFVCVAADKDDPILTKLLVDHGANPNVRDHRGRCALQLVEEVAPYVDVLVNDTTFNFKPLLIETVFDNLIHNNEADKLRELCNKYMDSFVTNNSKRAHLDATINSEIIAHAEPIIFRSELEHEYCSYIPQYLFNAMTNEACKVFYNIVSKNIDNLKLDDLSQFIDLANYVCDRLKKPKKFISGIYNVGMLKSLSDLAAVTNDAIEKNDIELLKKIAQTGRSDAVDNMTVRLIANETDRKLTAAVCKLLGRTTIDFDIVYSYLTRTDNEYLIAWFIDYYDDGLDELFTAVRSRGDASKVVRDAIQDYDPSDRFDSVIDLQQKRLKQKLIDAIKDDVYKDAQNAVKLYSAVLDDPSVIHVAYDSRYDNSYTAREIRKQIEGRTGQRKYDF